MKSNKQLRRDVMEYKRLYQQASATIMAMVLQAGGEIRITRATAHQIGPLDKLEVTHDPSGDYVYRFRKEEKPDVID